MKRGVCVVSPSKPLQCLQKAAALIQLGEALHKLTTECSGSVQDNKRANPEKVSAKLHPKKVHKYVLLPYRTRGATPPPLPSSRSMYIYSCCFLQHGKYEYSGGFIPISFCRVPVGEYPIWTPFPSLHVPTTANSSASDQPLLYRSVLSHCVLPCTIH